MLRFAFNAFCVVVLTLLTQIGGLAWLLALVFKRRVLAFCALYIGLSAATLLAAPQFGRVPLNCWAEGPLQMRAWVFCLTHRNYMVPDLKTALQDVAQDLDRDFPGTRLQVLDASFPFITGFPLLPHLSHDDGEKVDLAFFYERSPGSDAESTPSPIGYFAFEDGPTKCPKAWPTLRWDMGWLQPLWPPQDLDTARTKRTLELLASHPAISKVLLEPHLKDNLGLNSDKIRFQGCRAARHDDHIHLQL